MKSTNSTISLLLTACILFCACSQNPATDSSDFFFSTENIEGDEAYYSKPAVITGHISNHDVYPDVTEIGITMSFYDRVDNKQISLIYDDELKYIQNKYSIPDE